MYAVFNTNRWSDDPGGTGRLVAQGAENALTLKSVLAEAGVQ